ncbi:3',5'-cyclic adenosine monophosphate phosphodiesterase CpdA [Pseudomonas fluorescens]|uniref:3',5'-cyclic-AMP phosphodiesterase n=1 Tax=Pseudomonas fluorescens TaxID=294 RepID=UPI0012520DF8|nr:3',5'-cyclic-AMP phosphodiesterase [Pseudomonas fluorescens]CAG8864056.1 3',5'-cyclic adenosine monophosphate phosphodiesterase CpdA [Pseudomonas fluorescens]VVP94362.1 3',5'-cyclic adenosine monophosphate phosphodiesterase CpdA [Pseudomonas fluorescens]
MPQPIQPSESSPVHVLQLTDSHLFADAQGSLFGLNTRDSLRHVIAQARREQPRVDLLLATGDVSQDGSEASYAWFRQLTEPLGAQARWLPGNHDDRAAMARTAQGADLLQEVTDIGRWRIIMLNSQVVGATFGWLAEGQLASLDRALREAPDQHCLIAMHHQPVPIDCAWMASIGLRNADALFTVLEGHPQVRALLWGHVHQEWDQQRGGVRLLASPSTCIQFAPGCEDFTVSEQKPGYRWLRLHADGRVETGVSRAEDYEVRLDFNGPGY